MTVSGIDLNILKILQNQTAISSDKNTEFDSLFSELLKLFFKNDDLTQDNLMFLVSGIIPNLFPVQPEQNPVETQKPLISELLAPASPQQLSEQPEQKSMTLLPILSEMPDQIYQNELIPQLQPETNVLPLPVESEQAFIKPLYHEIFNKIQALPEGKKFLNEFLRSQKPEEISIKITSSVLTDQKTDIPEKLSQFKKESLNLSVEPVNLIKENNQNNISVQLSKWFPQNNSDRDSLTETFIIQTVQNKTDEKTKDDSIPKINIFSDKTEHVNYKITEKIELPVTRLQELSDIMFKAISTSNKMVTVQLEPPELGKILLRVSMDGEGIKAQMKVENPAVKDMIAGLIPEIKSHIQSSGVKINDFLLDLMKDRGQYGNSYNGQGQRRHNGNHKFFEYFA